MEIILLEHVEKLGKMGDKVHVKSGYARNYLLPQNKEMCIRDSLLPKVLILIYGLPNSESERGTYAGRR